ncbi:MAG: hypothetical protein ACKVTZ_24250 [Bacteroidia bacterium]
MNKIVTIAKKVMLVIACLIPGAIVIGLIESINAKIYPQPAGVSFETYLNSLPMMAFWIVLLSMVLGTMVSSFVISWIDKPNAKQNAWIIGVLFLIIGCINLASFPHPTWFTIVNVLVFIPAALFGSNLAMRWSKTTV